MKLPGWLSFVKTREFRSAWRVIVASAVIGIGAGIGAIFFNWVLERGVDLLTTAPSGYVPPKASGEGGTFPYSIQIPRRWTLFFTPILGGILCGLLVFFLCPEAEGDGVDYTIDAFHKRSGEIRGRVPIIKAIASAITIGSGGSAGREGPIAQIGAGIASVLSKVLEATPRERRILVMSGSGAGIGAIFRAPLGGALFASEVLYRTSELEADVLISSILSGIIAYSFFGFFYSWSPLFQSPVSYAFNLKELPFFAIMAILMIPAGFVYVKVFYGVRNFFRGIKVPPYFKPAIGGLLVGVIIYFFPQVAGTSYGYVQMLLFDEEGKIMPLKLLIVLGILKMFVTSFTLGSGGSGGVFAPSVVIGGFMGGAFAQFIKWYVAPQAISNPSAFVVVGMGCFFSAVAKVPLSAIIMVVEMTGNYEILVPITLANFIAFSLSGRWSIYQNQLEHRRESLAHRGEFIVDVLDEIRVRDAVELPQDVPFVYIRTPFEKVIEIMGREGRACVPVKDEDGKFAGVIFEETVLSLIYSGAAEDMKSIVIAADIMSNPSPSQFVKPDETLHSVLIKFVETGFEELPIVDENGNLLGTITHAELIRAYDRAITTLRRFE